MTGDPANLLDFHWEQIGGVPVVLTAPDSPSTDFLAPTIGAPETALRFRLTVTEYAPLQGKSADKVMKPSSGGGDPTGQAETEVTITVTQEIGDFGDAPDSTFNAYGAWYTNTAYPMGGGIPGRFPSAYVSTPPGQDAGPRHARGNIIFLGNDITREAEVLTLLGDNADETVNWQNALNTARAEAIPNDQDPFAWFNMGTNFAGLGLWVEASVAYDQARNVGGGLPWRMNWYQFGMLEALHPVPGLTRPAQLMTLPGKDEQPGGHATLLESGEQPLCLLQGTPVIALAVNDEQRCVDAVGIVQR